MSGHHAQVAVDGVRKDELLGLAALDVHAAHHLVFGGASPVLGVALEAESLAARGKAGLANDGFPGPRGGLDDGGHGGLSWSSLGAVPNLYL